MAAQLTAAAVLGFLGQLLAGSSRTYFGPPDRITAIGAAYSVVLGGLLCLSLFALWRHRPWARAVAWLIPALNVAAFVQPILASPMAAGAILLWNLWLLGRLLVPEGPVRRRSRTAPKPDVFGVWLWRQGPASRHLLWVSAVTTIVVVGFERATHPAVPVACGVLGLVALASGARFAWMQVREGAHWPWTVVVLTVAALVAVPTPAAALLLGAAAQLFLLMHLFRLDTSFLELRHAFLDHPALLILFSFIALISVGTLLLSFPIASTTPGSIGLVDAAFTATSAACVTGLIVLDTPVDFTTFGHAVILVLIQVGGLNIMVLSTFGALVLGRGLGLRGERALGEVLDVKTPDSAYRLIAFIVFATLAVEALGAVALGLAYLQDGMALAGAAWVGLFHAVSAFCNAGFALHSDSLVRFQDNPGVLLVMAALITAGGLGFVVLAGWLPWTRTRGLQALQTHSRVVLMASAVLVAAGTVAYAAGEWTGALAGLSPVDRLANAFFQSVTLRTAGFNSVPTDAAGPATSLWMMVFMFIGASPGGTGGGIKTTTTVLLLAAIPAILRGRPRAVLWGRTASLDGIYRSAAIATVSALLLVFGGVLLLATQQATFQSLMFETFSAFGTVGLSLGATTTLDSFGKTVIMALMLVGRIGPLSLALLLGRRLAPRVEYPEARILVG